MKKTISAALLSLCFAGLSLGGGEVPPLTLSDGRVFEDWKVTGDSALSVIIKYKGGLAKVPKALLPEPLRSAYLVDAAQLKVEQQAAIESQRVAQIRANQLRESRRLQREQTAVSKHSPASSSSGQADDRRILEMVSEAAKTGAKRYFRYDYEPSAINRAWSVSVEVETEEPEQWAGFPGRYTVKGRAFIRYYDWYWSSSTRQSTKDFTVLVDATNTTAKVAEVRMR